MEESPHKLEELRSIAFSDHIVPIEKYSLQEDLQQQYVSFKQQRGEQSKCQRALACCGHALAALTTIAH